VRELLKRWLERPPTVQIPSDFPVPPGATLTEHQVDRHRAIVSWDLGTHRPSLELHLCYALRRRGFAVRSIAPSGTLHDGMILAISRGDVAGVVSSSRSGGDGDGPLQMSLVIDRKMGRPGRAEHHGIPELE
jgi:hypothetical protein